MASIPAVVALHGRHQARGLRAVSVTPNPSAADGIPLLQQVIDNNHMPYPTYLDEGGVYERAANLVPSPVFLVLGRDGRVVYRYRGLLERDSEAYNAMNTAIEQALAQQ